MRVWQVVITAVLLVAVMEANSSALADDFSTCRDTSGEAAIAACTRAINSGHLNTHDLTVAYYNRGDEYGRMGDYDKSIADNTEAIRLAPRYPAALTNRGVSYHRKGDDDRALADYNRAIQLDPTYEDAFINRASLYQLKGDFAKALADLNQAITIKPDDAEAYADRGDMYSNERDYDRAIADYDRALSLNPNLSQAKEHRANAVAMKGQGSEVSKVPQGDAWNTGSVFAAGVSCEGSGYMSQGQTVAVMTRLLRGLASVDAQNFRDGYQEGLKRTAVYSKNAGGWVSYPLTAEGCRGVQNAISQYKTMIDTIGR